MRKIMSEQLAEQTPHSAMSSGSGDKGDAGGYLAIYPALYEPDMGVEFAQFPSKEYNGTYRTDVLFYGISRDGRVFEPLNHNKAVRSPQGCIRLQSPSLFRRHGGGYGLAAAADEEPSGIVVYGIMGVLAALLFMLGMYALNRRLIQRRIQHDRHEETDSNGYSLSWPGLLPGFCSPVILRSRRILLQVC